MILVHYHLRMFINLFYCRTFSDVAQVTYCGPNRWKSVGVKFGLCGDV